MTLKDLAPRDARLALAVDRFVRRELGVDWRGATLVAAVSGGADSVALLVLLCALREHLGLNLAAAHLDHALRVESAEDAEAVRALCECMHVPLHTLRRDVGALAAQRKVGLEEAGREARYAFFEEVRHKARADWIVTGHHLGDLAEDVLLRLIRGASWPALGGMRAVTGSGVLRPLLLTDKADLIALLQRRHIPWREDASNADDTFRRNRIRHGILPLLLAENPGFLDGVRHLWRSARLDEAYWAGMTHGLARRTGDGRADGADKGLLLPAEALQGLPKPGRLRAYAEAVRGLGGQPRADGLFALDNAWEQRRRNKDFCFPGPVRARLSREGVRFVAELADNEGACR